MCTLHSLNTNRTRVVRENVPEKFACLSMEAHAQGAGRTLPHPFKTEFVSSISFTIKKGLCRNVAILFKLESYGGLQGTNGVKSKMQRERKIKTIQ